MLPYMIGGVVAVLAFVLGGLFGYQRRRATAEREIGSAEEEAKRIVNEAYKSAESKKREALVEAKEEILKARNEYEREGEGTPGRPAEAGAPAAAEGREPGPQDREHGAQGGASLQPFGQAGSHPGRGGGDQAEPDGGPGADLRLHRRGRPRSICWISWRPM